MTIFAELAKKYISFKIRLKLMAQATAGIKVYTDVNAKRRRNIFFQFYADLWAMLDVLEDVGAMTFKEVCDAKNALEAYYNRNYGRITEVRARE